MWISNKPNLWVFKRRELVLVCSENLRGLKLNRNENLHSLSKLRKNFNSHTVTEQSFILLQYVFCKTSVFL